MNEYLKFFITAFALMILAGIIVNSNIPKNNIMPAVEASTGIIFSSKVSTSTPLNTGYLVKYIPDTKVSGYAASPPAAVSGSKQSPSLKANIIKNIKPEVQTQKKEPVKDDMLNLYTIENIIKGSDKSYTLNKTKEIKDVSVELLTVTPFKGGQILKFRVNNNTDKYFIPQDVGISEVQSRLLFKQVINAKETSVGYLVFPVKGSSYTFSMVESGGAYRKFSILF
ncbi:MAG: hypothetical protein ABII64_01945 [Elusimicrobiota bacterium]